MAVAPVANRPSGRLPPSDLQAEASVLSAVLLTADAFDRVQGVIEPQHFFSHQHRVIYECVTELHATGHAVDLATVAALLRDHNQLGQAGGTPYLAQIVDATPAVSNVVEHAQIVFEKWRLRQVITLAQGAIAEASTGVIDVQSFIEVTEQGIGQLAQLNRETGLESLAQIAALQLSRIDEARKTGEALLTGGSPTHVEHLDKLTGGLYDGDLYIVASRPGMGKTSFVTTLSKDIARERGGEPGEGVAFFSLEMPRDQIALRIICSEAAVDVSAVRKHTLSNGEYDRLVRAYERIQTMAFWIDDTPAITLMELRARVRKLKREIENGSAAVKAKRLKLVVVDYLQLMTGQRSKQDNREREVSSLSQGLKTLAKREKIAVMAVSQLNRAVETRTGKDHRPKLSDLRESGAIEQDADDVWFVHRPGYYDSTVKQSETELIVAKQRNGPVGIVHLFFDGAHTRFLPTEAGEPPGDYKFDDIEGFEDA